VRTKNPKNLLSRYIHNSVKKGTKKSTRKRTIVEVYSDRYYKSKLQCLVNQELENDPGFASLSQKKKIAHQLSVYRRIRVDCWKGESDEVKAEIQALFDEENGIKNEEENADGIDSDTKEDDVNDGDDEDNDEKNLLRHQQK
jgi:hypothetical protein